MENRSIRRFKNTAANTCRAESICTRIIDTFECRVTRFRPNTVWRRRLTVVNALTTTANISIGSTIKSISWLPTKIPRYAFIPEIGKQRGIFSIRNRNHGDHFCNLKAKLSYRVGLKNRSSINLACIRISRFANYISSTFHSWLLSECNIFADKIEFMSLDT